MENRRNELIHYIKITLADYSNTRDFYNSLVQDKFEQVYEDRQYRLRKLSYELKQMKRELKYYHREISKIDSNKNSKINKILVA